MYSRYLDYKQKLPSHARNRIKGEFGRRLRRSSSSFNSRRRDSSCCFSSSKRTSSPSVRSVLSKVVSSGSIFFFENISSGMLRIIQRAEKRHLADYRRLLFRFSIPIAGVVNLVQEYCSDIYALEEEVLREFYETYASTIPVPLTSEGFKALFNFMPEHEHLTLQTPEAKAWATDVYRLGGRHDLHMHRLVWLYAFHSVFKTYRLFPCRRPFCYWRAPPECICSRPVQL